MSLSVHRRPRDAVAGKGGPIGTRDAATGRHHAPAAASTSSYSSSPEGAEPARPSWQPLPFSLPKRRRVGTNNSSDPASGPASRRTAARMTWPPERTPRRPGLAGGGGALPSPKPRGLTREEDYLGWLGSLRSGPKTRALADADADADTNTNTSAARSPTASGGIHASASSPAIRSSALTGTPKGWPQASAASPLGSAPSPLSALATASHGARRQSRTTKQLTGTRGDPPLQPKAKLPTGTPSALPPLQTTKPTPESPSPQTGPAPPPPFLAAFGHRLVEVLLKLNHFRAATPQLTTGTRGGASPLQANTVLFDLNYGHLGYTGVVLMGVYAGLMELLSGWKTILKVFYVLLLILGAFGLGTGLMAATSVQPTGYTHRVSSVCSRLCTCLATFVFIVALACHMGSHGYIAGIVLGVVAVCYMLSVWIEGDPTAYGAFTWVWTAIKDLWQRFKWSGQRGPLLP
ncbi:hypothetical protein SETIT_2G047400v2 [Setaria italica]|uniref:Uncharacterized protein n=1 Tax=Setaria italica TaxID=4555 RepID=A0A368PV51_SETIT|nr:hypothetical protein SETIT_2G047400v2 [Setaria italica]